MRGRDSLAVTALAAAVPLALAAALSLARDALAPSSAALVLVLAVVGAAALGTRWDGVVAALSSAAWFDYFLTEPYLTFAIADPEDLENAVLLMLVGLAVSELASWGRRQRERAGRRSGYLDGVLATSAAAAGAAPVAETIDRVRAQVVDVLGVDDCWFSADLGGHPPRLERDGRVTHDGHDLDVDRHGLPTDDVIEILVEHAGSARGRLLLSAATTIVAPEREQRLVAIALADLAGVALARAQETPERP